VSMSVGVLYVVATPIGNLDDISTRALAILEQVDLIAAEDTRHSLALLRRFSIKTPCIAYHEHNERTAAQGIVRRLLAGESVAIISDAGTPLVSDPGYHLVRHAHEAGVKVCPIPGASALISAVSVSGLPSNRFIYEGFLPAKAAARLENLKTMQAETGTMIFYESPRRLKATLQDMIAVFGGEREATIARELTKLFEAVHFSDLDGLKKWVEADAHREKGEVVILVRGAAASTQVLEKVELEVVQILAVLMADVSLKQAVALTTKMTGIKRNAVYELAIGIKDAAED